jgi:hypothetical protein
MATLVEFRAQYPQYNDMPDVALADALHQKFYADMPKADFYKSVALNPAAFIPDNQNMITLPKTERSAQDKLMGYVETPAIIAGNIGRAITAPIAKYGTEALVGWNTPQGIKAGQQAAQTVSSQFYQPRTETGPEVANAIGEALGSLPPTPLTSAGTALSTLMPTATNQLRNIVVPATKQAVAPATNVLASAMQRGQQPSMQGMGAAQTSEQLMREERLQRLGIPATAGERTKSLAQQQFEADVARGVVTGISEEEKTRLAERMRAFKTNQKQAITNNFERMTQDVGAEVADPTQMRQIGRIVDKAVNDEYTKKYDNYKALYQKADQSGETLQPVSYQGLLDYINTKTPTTRQKLDPILDSVAESLAMNDPDKTGTITVRALEDIYQQIGKVKNSPNAGELKKIITDMGEGAGGELYQAARTARSQLAKEFEDVSRVDKLLGTKAGYTDRRVALDDVFKHIVLDGSLEEMRTVTKLLKKAGPQGQQAYAELQGQTLQHMKELLTKGDQLSFKNLNTLVTQLDSEDKLAYMFGKTGRDQIMDLRDAIKDVVVKEPGAVNFPNTAGAVLRGLETLQSVRVPGAKSLAEVARTREVSKKVEEALKQPNKLVPSQSSINSLAP